MGSTRKPELDYVVNVIGLAPREPLITFIEMWYQIFLWALFSSVVLHLLAALLSFATMRKHQFGKYYPFIIMIMGFIAPMTSGIVSSAIIAFVYRASNIPMTPLYAMFWGAGQTLLSTAVGFTRILATL